MKTLDSKTGYNLYSEKYSKHHAYLDSFDRTEFIEHIGKPVLTLDIGAGDGRLYAELKKRSLTVVSLDLAKEILKKNCGSKNLRVAADALFFPFKNACFDLAVASFLMVHIEHPGELFSSVYDILKQNGRFVFNIIPQKTPLSLNVFNKKFKIESFYHSPSKIENQLKSGNFIFSREEIIKERGKWTSIIYDCRKF